jgi:hypothetical protein
MEALPHSPSVTHSETKFPDESHANPVTFLVGVCLLTEDSVPPNTGIRPDAH